MKKVSLLIVLLLGLMFTANAQSENAAQVIKVSDNLAFLRTTVPASETSNGEPIIYSGAAHLVITSSGVQNWKAPMMDRIGGAGILDKNWKTQFLSEDKNVKIICVVKARKDVASCTYQVKSP